MGNWACVSLPDADAIRRKAAEVVSRPEYRVEGETGDGRYLWELFLRALGWILAPFRWLYEYLQNVHPVLAWIYIAALLVLLVLLVFHIIYTFKVALARRDAGRNYAAADQAESTDPRKLEQQADEASRRGDHIGAVRLLFRAALLRLHQTERRPWRRGMTNREHLRRYRQTGVFAPLRQMVDVIDQKWYGDARCDGSDLELCRAAYAAIVRHVGEAVRVQRT